MRDRVKKGKRILLLQKRQREYVRECSKEVIVPVDNKRDKEFS